MYEEMRKSIIVLFIVLLSVVGACSNQETPPEEHHQEEQHESAGDLREETASTDELPTFLDGKPEDMKTLYTAVSQHQTLLESIPCYCGCGESVGHRDNYDCFIHQNNDDGSLVWDDHATKCQACLDIAAESIIEFSNGKSIKEIRNMIDQQYEEGYPAPTPTPEV